MPGSTSQAKELASERIRLLANECSEEGWDGNGADPISHVSVMQAERLVQSLPADIPIPELTPEPDGCISFDWIESPGRLVTLSTGAGSCLAYAWLDGADRGHGIAGFDDTNFPKRIADEIRRITGRSSIRSS